MMKASEAEDGPTVLMLTFHDSGSVRDYEMYKQEIDAWNDGTAQFRTSKSDGSPLTILRGITQWRDAAERVAEELKVQMQIRRQGLTLAVAFLSAHDCNSVLAKVPARHQEIIENESGWSRAFWTQRRNENSSNWKSEFDAICEEYGLHPDEFLEEDHPSPWT